MKKDYYAVIMAGGGGTRLWPSSRKNNPKQLLAFDNERSMFRNAIDRLKGVFNPENIKIVTVEEQVTSLMKEAPELTANQFIIEPFPKGTASVVGLAAIHLRCINPEAVMAILTADHVIGNLTEFHNLLERGFKRSKEDRLVTLGIQPAYPSTGYGYIKFSKPINGAENYLVDRFVEKPDLDTATQYVEEGNYYWNSGMFMWRAEKILEEISRFMPDLRTTLMKIEGIIGQPEYSSKIKSLWDEITPQTIDYGIMEKAKDVVMLKTSNLDWNDVGSWDSLSDILQSDEHSNVVKARNSILLGCQNMIIQEENEKKIISAVNLENLVIIDTDDALLICRKGETQKVRQIVEELKRRDLKEYL